MKLMLSEILEKAAEFKSKPAKIKFLKQHDSPALRQLLQYTYDPNIKWLLPEGPAPYTPANDSVEAQGMLYTNLRRLYLFIEGGNPNLSSARRELLFIQLLESVDPKDAELLVAVKDKKLPYKGLNEKIIKDAGLL